jgi:hypothetical protein
MRQINRNIAFVALVILLAIPLSARASVVNFGLGADDFGTLTINGIPVCTYNNISAAGGCNGSIDLQPGVWYDVVIDYMNRYGSNGMSLTWDRPGGTILGYGFAGSFSHLVPKVNFRTLDATGINHVSGLRGDYYDLSGNLQSTVIGEGPLDASNTVYNNQLVGSWNGYGYFSLFEERLSGQIQLPPSQCSVSVEHVKMFDAHTLEIDVTGEFSSDQLSGKTLSVSTTIGNVALNDSFPLTPGLTGLQSTSFFFDLATQNIPRFNDNTNFVVTSAKDENGNACTGAPQNAVVLLPVVIIPGIFSGDGGDGTFPDLELTLRTVFAGYGLLGARCSVCKSYQLTTDVVGYPTIGYPTLYTLSYRTSSSSFHEAAIDLNALLKQIKTATYADKVNIVTHSKGGLVARQYLVGRINNVGVNQLIMTVPPNLGATGASWANLDPTGLKVNLSNLLPVWPWTRSTVLDDFVTAKPFNKELDDLNQQPLPPDVVYTLIYSSSYPTVFTQTGSIIKKSPVPLVFDFKPGDGVVPTFSMLGLKEDPNNPLVLPELIPAFNGVAITPIRIAGFHKGYLEQPAVMQQVVSTLVP